MYMDVSYNALLLKIIKCPTFETQINITLYMSVHFPNLDLHVRHNIIAICYVHGHISLLLKIRLILLLMLVHIFQPCINL